MCISLTTISLLLSIASCGVQATQTIITGVFSGVDPSTGAFPARQEINDLYEAGGPTWDLLVQAMSEFEAVDESETESYFQVTGIHGLPFISWNGVEQAPNGAYGGYCPHSELLFGTWHRPYVALFEQILNQHAVAVANRYTGSQAATYQTAAAALRLPFWDWAVDPALPVATVLEYVTVNGPDGATTLRNPLRSYKFQNYPFTLTGMPGSSLSGEAETMRCPNATSIVDATAVLNNLAPQGATFLRDTVYQMFITVQSFAQMVTTKFSGSSIESPHNVVHTGVGCANGAMWDLNWSAFDPIFMLHHANVDRQLAMWQAIYYTQSMFTSSDQAPATYGTSPGNVDANTPLTPFTSGSGAGDGTFWTSNTISDMKTFGYTYPDFNGTDGMQGEDLAKAIKYQVNKLYSEEGVSSSSSTAAKRADAVGTTSQPQAQQPSVKEYTLVVSIEKSDVPLPATIEVHLAGYFAGRIPLTTMPMQGVVHSVLPLKGPLQHKQMRYEEAATVVEYLKESLEVKIQKADESLVSAPASLSVEIGEQDVQSRVADDAFPVGGEVRKHQGPPLTLY